MNFLAHLSLSDSDPEIMVGNFIGDFVKGKAQVRTFAPGIARGIELHREIDRYTDSHPVVQQSKNRLRPKYNHYAGVIVDMFYDHFLAANWSAYYDIPLGDFAQQCYRVIQQHHAVLPERAKRMLPYVVEGNWLVSYTRVENIGRALTGMSQRTQHDSKMNEAGEDLVHAYPDFKAEFGLFFPDLRRWASNWLSARRADS